MVHRVEEARRGEERLLVIIIRLFCLYIVYYVFFTAFCPHALLNFGENRQMNAIYFSVRFGMASKHVVYELRITRDVHILQNLYYNDLYHSVIINTLQLRCILYVTPLLLANFAIQRKDMD